MSKNFILWCLQSRPDTSGFLNSNARGNAILISLIAIGLFATLIVGISNSNNASDTSGRQKNKVIVSSILSFANNTENTVDALLNNGTADTAISFEGGPSGAYTNAGSGDKDKVFNKAGGGLTYEKPDAKWLVPDTTSSSTYGDWLFTGDDCVTNVGTGPAGTRCNSGGSAANAELVMILPFLNKDICVAINKKLGIALDDTDAYPNYGYIVQSADRFTGSYSTTNAIQGSGSGTAFNGKAEACVKVKTTTTVEVADSYYFYKVLIAR